MKHIPVLHSATLGLLDPREGEVVIDVTVGLGGHAKSFLERVGPEGKLIGIDADDNNVMASGTLEVDNENVRLIHANFRDIASLSLEQCDILFADLGVSSPHLDDPSRGFSFRGDGPLDCRYDRSQGFSVSEFIRHSSEQELVRIFKEYGELRKVLLLSHAVKEAKPQTTRELSDVAQSVYGRFTQRELPKVFQALRIAVNDELGALHELLLHGPTLLRSCGRMGIIAYHSLEDRLVKRRFRELTTPAQHPVTGAEVEKAPFELLTRKAVQSDVSEIENNPRARSARFRAIRKCIEPL